MTFIELILILIDYLKILNYPLMT